MLADLLYRLRAIFRALAFPAGEDFGVLGHARPVVIFRLVIDRHRRPSFERGGTWIIGGAGASRRRGSCTNHRSAIGAGVLPLCSTRNRVMRGGE